MEDAAHAAGAAYKGKKIGSHSEIVNFSFHPIKNMTTGEGGMLVTDDEAFAQQVRLWRFHGVARDAWAAYGRAAGPPASYDVVLPGFKYNLTDIQAAIGIHQLARLSEMNARRAALAARYRAALGRLPGLRLPGEAPYPAQHACHLFPVVPADRTRFISGLAARGIGSGVHFEAVHLHRYFREQHGGRPGQCPVAEAVCAHVVSLPLYPTLREADVDEVAKAVTEVVHGESAGR
jgi:dTDP-4-amino-4,6-dideoxygalactose transaminase